MAKVLVVTSGKGGVGKTTTTAALGAALAQGGQSVVVVDFDVGLRNLDLVMGAERRVVFDLINVVQGVAKLLAGADPRQAAGESVAAAGLADPRQGRADRRGRRPHHRRALGPVRLDPVRQPGRHRARRDAGDALCRRGRHRHQSRSLLGARFRPHHRHARFQDREGGEGRAGQEAHPDHPLRSGARGARRDADHRRHPRNSRHPLARHHSREPGRAEARPMSARR